MDKSIEQISSMISRKVEMMLIELLPEPSCPRKKDQNNWKREQVRKQVSNKLNPQSLGISVTIDVQ